MQLRVAPYSYDWIDNFGRSGPPVRDARNEQLAKGQRWMTIFRLVDFEVDRHLTLEIDRTQVKQYAERDFANHATCGGSAI